MTATGAVPSVVVPSRDATAPVRLLAAAARSWRAYSRHRGPVIGLAILLLLATVALLAPVIAPYDPAEIDPAAVYQTPSPAHWLGADVLGRDVLSRMLYATQLSLPASVLAVSAASFVGVTLGVLVGYIGGRLDMLVMRFIDALMSIPGLLIAMTVIAVLGPGLGNATIALAIMMMPTFVRLTRAQVQAVVVETFVDASRTVGSSGWRIVLRHVLPNSAAPIIVQVFLAMGYALLAEGALSYLGLSVQPPEMSWGSILQMAFTSVDVVPWLIYIPGAAIMVSVLSFNLVGDGLRAVLLRREAQAVWL